ncbi:MAG TPA: hypothetical protein VFW19_07380 [Allosphingosinicella sp.]|nr:hypothetical protein [Allosphingosinicella sp.]
MGEPLYAKLMFLLSRLALTHIIIPSTIGSLKSRLIPSGAGKPTPRHGRLHRVDGRQHAAIKRFHKYSLGGIDPVDTTRKAMDTPKRDR